MNKNVLIGIVVVLAAVGLIFVFRPAPVVQFGAISSPDVYGYMNVHGVFQQGGTVYATSTVVAAATLIGSTLSTANIVDYTTNLSAVTITLPASTTMPLGDDVGSMRTIWIRNATTTALNLTIAGGTGTLLKVASSTNGGAAVIYGDTDGGNHARLDFLRKANSDIEVFMTTFKD